MSFMTRFAALFLGLPPAVTHRLEAQIDLPVPMPDGIVLKANRVAPVGGENLPIILIRNPYTPRGEKPDLVSQLIAERGYQVVMQNCRGTWGSEGEFRPFRDDREDGLATLQWLSRQPWFSGSVGMYGLSYWGYAQFALGPGAPDFLKALVPQMAASRLYGVYRPHTILALDTALAWHYLTYVMNRQVTPSGKRQARAERATRLRQGFFHLPLNEADQAALGFTAPFFQDMLINEQPDDPLWKAMDHSKMVEQIAAPVHMIGGWYDFFLSDQLADYAALQSSGKQPHLTIGPWKHGDTASVKVGLQQSLAWYDAYLKNNRAALRPAPVKICIMGINKWIDLPAWPPPSNPARRYLQPDGRLSPGMLPGNCEPSVYQYHPEDPTPSLGGAVVFDGGPKDNRQLETRPDVRIFTSTPLPHEVTIIGSVSVELFVRSSAVSSDFFVRLCDVFPGNGKSINICDGIVRFTPNEQQAGTDGSHRVTIQMSPTAYCFKKGHSIRLQVSSGAHPMFARNLGTGEPIATGTAMRASDVEIFHDESHPSAVILPVVSLAELAL